MLKKSLRNAVAGTVAAGALILPAATVVAPQMQLVACQYPNSIVTSTNLQAPNSIIEGSGNTATVNVNGQGGPNGEVRFKIVGPLKKGKDPVKREETKPVTDGEPVTFNFGGDFKAGKKYMLKAKFFGNCRYQNSSDKQKVTVQAN